MIYIMRIDTHCVLYTVCDAGASLYCTFPPPDAPHKATVSPAFMFKLYPLHTWMLGREGYAKVTSFNSIVPNKIDVIFSYVILNMIRSEKIMQIPNEIR
jgi:hypothetical protein